MNERLKVDQSNIGTSGVNGPTVLKGCVEKWIRGPSGLKSIHWEGNDPIIVEKNTILPSTCHRVVSIEEGSGKNEPAQGMHGPCKTKGSTTIKNKALSMKEIIKWGIKCV